MIETVKIEQAVLEKLRQLAPDKQQKVLDFVTTLHQEQGTLPSLNLSLQQIAALPVEERDRLLAPYIAITAEDFRTDPELTEFSVLDGDDWDSEHE
jgi:hypothetical protein